MSALLNNLSHFFRLSSLWPDFRRRPVFKFIANRSGPFDGAVTLTRDRVYIVPTKAGLIFALLLLVLLIGSINYEKNLGFVLTFLLASVGNVLLLATWRNLAGLEIRSCDSQPVFAGQPATFSVQLVNHQLLERFSIAISQLGDEQDIVNCAASSPQTISFKKASRKRGLLNAGRFRLYTEFPSGLFFTWTWIDLSMSCLVYPAPDDDTRLPVYDYSDSGDTDSSGRGMENFSHLRKYQQGDNISRISWKAAAKNDELLSKECVGAKPVTHWINWNEIPARDNEHRLSIMTALIIQAENHQQHYGIKLPEKQIAPDLGHQHFHQCLTALALH